MVIQKVCTIAIAMSVKKSFGATVKIVIAGGNYSEYTVQRLRDGYKAVEHSVHLTAVHVGFVSFLAGSFLGWLVAYTQIGGR